MTAALPKLNRATRKENKIDRGIGIEGPSGIESPSVLAVDKENEQEKESDITGPRPLRTLDLHRFRSYLHPLSHS